MGDDSQVDKKVELQEKEEVQDAGMSGDELEIAEDDADSGSPTSLKDMGKLIDGAATSSDVEVRIMPRYSSWASIWMV